MLIREDLLLSSGAKIGTYTKGQFIFKENTEVHSYFQILTGKVKIVSHQKKGREFIHNIPTSGDCLGEIFLFLQHQYSVSAVAMEKSSIFILERSNFALILKNNPDILLQLYKCMAENMHYNYLMNGQNVETPAEKTIKLLQYLKNSNQLTASNQVLLSRQEIASLTGLRVETIIRTVKYLQSIGTVTIVNGKIIFE
ncbi:Crp/Fnr family transcriptional regulator [Chryseobacterium taiwanense]|uniref:Crp/Fnr family transcriptional regulator n=1 Tax=Chryseobacterium taiwanense TaxID=363331 RepID=A0A0B4CJA9_9FLAO|nr:Crp/Fnr family transcriptional regulator [Chryseobacterium taiwanense]KIC61324.1 Crp/Fnr family transcriptional regulator [Chryseobacterium taiwanense]